MIKRTMALGAAVAITGAAAISCDNPSWTPNDPSPETADSTLTDTKNTRGQVSFEAQYVRTASDGGPATEPAVISSRAELEQYGSYIPNHRISGDGVRSNGFTAPTAKYTDSFFADKFLVIVPKTEGSGSISHRVESVGADGNIYITRILPEGGYADIAAWHIIIELDNSSRLSAYNAVFTDYQEPIIDPVPPLPCGASSNTKDYATNCRPPVSDPVGPPVTPLPYDYKPDYIRTGSIGSRTEDPVIISSADELEQYALSVPNGAGRIGLTAPEYRSGPMYYEFTPVVDKYPADYFKNNFLVIIPKNEGSGSIRHKVVTVDANGNIYIERILPEKGTADMAAWYIVVPLENEGKSDAYKAIFRDSGPAPVPVPAFDASAVQYLEAGYLNYTPVFGEYPVINAVTSRAQLMRDFDFSKGYVDSGFVKSYLPQYDDDFFKSKSLIILSLLEGTGGTKHKVLHIDDNGDIVISRAIGDAIPIRPCPWTIIIPISKDSKLEKYNVVIRDEP